ncbi:hypothetical protein Tco_0111263, partial [Tanacetum coccineum]
MADWKSQVLQNFEVTKDKVDYVNVKYGTSWIFNNEVSDEILDDLLKRVYDNQQRVKDDKATETEIIDDVNKENVNVEVVLNKPKNNKLKGKELIILDSDTCNSDDSWEPTKSVNKINLKSVLKGKHGTSSVSFKGRKGSPSKKGSCSKSTKTKPSKVLKFFDDSSSDDHGSVFRASNVIKFYSDSSLDDHGSVFRGKPGSTSKGVRAPKHSRVALAATLILKI